MASNITTGKILERFKKVHGDRYDYSLVEYKGSEIKVKIICREHGEFEQLPKSHTKREGCTGCRGIVSNTEQFIKKSKEVHKGKFDYSKTNYIRSKSKVIITCLEHGDFEMIPNSHLGGIGCSSCAGVKPLNNKTFASKSIKLHGNKYDYSLVEYKNHTTSVDIICSKHGVFKQTPRVHLMGSNCQKCSGTHSMSKSEFIDRSKEVHPGKFDYSKAVFINNSTRVEIICPEHGEFKQLPTVHLNGFGCSRCSGKNKLTTQEFIEDSRVVHGDKFDYSLVKYVRALSKVKIICKKHGEFKQRPNDHKNGVGCPVCKLSTGEEMIYNILKENKIDYECEKKFDGCINKSSLRFDFFISKYNMCIEFHGEQHFSPLEFFGGTKNMVKRQKRDVIKENYCKENDLGLVIVWRDGEDVNFVDLHGNCSAEMLSILERYFNKLTSSDFYKLRVLKS